MGSELGSRDSNSSMTTRATTTNTTRVPTPSTPSSNSSNSHASNKEAKKKPLPNPKPKRLLQLSPAAATIITPAAQAPTASQSQSTLSSSPSSSISCFTSITTTTTTTRTAVVELATKFLEENVRNCIKPRIFPMENTYAPARVPTPFVFTTDRSIRHQVIGSNNCLRELHEGSPIPVSNNRTRSALHPYFNKLSAEYILKSYKMSSPARKPHGQSHQNSRSDFASTLKKWSAPIPPVLSRKLGRASDSPLGKVKVMLRVCDNAEEVSGSGILGVDQRRKQVTLIDPGGSGPGTTPEERRVGVSAPKMFAFDGIFGEDDDQSEICAASAAELVASVVGGEDGCFVSLGYCTTGKKQTMFGRPANQKMGVVPTAVSWLFKSIQEQRQKTGSRFSVRVSAVEVTGGSGHEVINDLLLPFVNDGDQPPGSYLVDSGLTPGSKSTPAPLLNTVSEVRAPNPETAGFFLDAALEAMNKEDPIRHFVFTLHVYQYTVDKNGKGVVGGRSRLHNVLLGNGSPSISVLGGLLLAVLNGQRHLPSRDSKLGAILRECLGSLTCRAVVMIHVSNAHSRYAETLAALQLGSRVHRLRRSRRLKMGSVGSGNGSGGSSGGSGEEMRNGLPTNNQVGEGETGSSDIDPSSSEQSCDTVIYLGPTIDDATDGEHPPVYLPSLETTATPGENGCETKIIPSKCPLAGSCIPPKTKSPKPKSSSSNNSKVEGGFSKSEEQWVDGPKVAKYRHTTSGNGASGNNTNNGTASPAANGAKKSETWIDGPAARVHHQASNFPSPKKSVKMRSGGASIALSTPADSCSISSTKAQMIQKWISNQTHSFVDDSHLQDSFFGGGVGGGGGRVAANSQSNRGMHLPLLSSLHSVSHSPAASMGIPNASPFFHQYPTTTHSTQNSAGHSSYSHLNNYSSNNINTNNDPEYKALTVFKTCEDFDDELEPDSPGNGFEFEFIEVVEPETPVPTRDACLQVTEEDIAMSFLEENPLPESDQNFVMGPDCYFSRARSSSFSEGPSCSSNASFAEKNDDHPLRVLSQECLTVVSTFTDSMSIAGGDIERFWPRMNFTNDITMQDIHEVGMCHGLCKNLVSLSQMSLSNSAPFGGLCERMSPMSPTNNNTFTTGSLKSPFTMKSNHINGQSENYHISTNSLIKDLPTLSDESIFKIPAVPKPKQVGCPTKSEKVREPSDAEQETITIPPMKLLDLAPIRNNTNPVNEGHSPSPTLKSKAGHHRGCDHNHHNQHGNSNQNLTTTINSNGNNSNGNGSGGSGSSCHSGLSNQRTLTPPSSPSHPMLQQAIEVSTVNVAITKSPSKSKSRKISKFFRTRSKSPKTAGATSSSESGKSSVSSADAKSSSSSSCSSGVSGSNTKQKCHSSPAKHQSPSKKSISGKNHCFSAAPNNSSEYHFTCDSVLPMFLPSPTQNHGNGISSNIKDAEEIKSK